MLIDVYRKGRYDKIPDPGLCVECFWRRKTFDPLYIDLGLLALLLL